MKIIDTRGHLCPAPLIMTKRAINAAEEGDQDFTVITDNDTARCNLLSFLSEMGIQTRTSEQGSDMYIYFTRTVGKTIDLPDSEIVCSTTKPQAEPNNDYVVVLRSETMGDGSDELGAVLIRAFLNSLMELTRLPSTILAYNGGVKLAIKGSDCGNALTQLASMGIKVILCGACVDYFGIKPQLTADVEIGNMYKINMILSETAKVVYP